MDAKPDEPEVDPAGAETVEVNAICAAELEADAKTDEAPASEPEAAPRPEAEAARGGSRGRPRGARPRGRG